MAKNDTLTLLKKQIKDQKPDHLYLFFGEETFLKEHYIQQLFRLVPDGGFEEFNHRILDGKDTAPDLIDDAIDSFPMMTDRKIVLIKDSGAFKSPKEALKAYYTARFKNLPEDTVLIFDEQEVDKRSALYKAAAKEGTAVEFAHLSETDLVTWVLRECGAMGRKISKDNAAYLISICDPGLGALKNELEKLANYCDEEITKSHIDRLVSKSLQIRVFELCDALMEKNTDKALSMLQDLKTVKESPFKLLYLLFSTFDKMLRAKLMEQEGEAYPDIAKSLGVAPFIARKYMTGAKGFSSDVLEALVKRASMTDLQIKQGKIDDWTALEEYIFIPLKQ